MITIGHRGAAGYEPENTLLSFRKAIDLKVDMIEFDVQLCKSGEAVVIHDYSLERTTTGRGFVADKTLSELQELDAGKDQKIPTLKESLQAIGNKAKVNIELKGKSPSVETGRIVNSFIEKGIILLENIVFSSFMIEELRIIRKLLPDARVALLFEELPGDFYEIAAELKASSINLNFEFLTKDIVEEIHIRGHQVYAYTVNNPADKARMKTWSVDGIFTDFP